MNVTTLHKTIASGIIISLFTGLVFSARHHTTTYAEQKNNREVITPTPSSSSFMIDPKEVTLGVISRDFSFTKPTHSPKSFLFQKPVENKKATVAPTKSVSSPSSVVPTQMVTPSITNAPSQENRPTPTPVSHSLLNSSFEETSGNWASNWIRATDVFSLDTNSNGNNGKNSVHILTNVYSPSHYFHSQEFIIDSKSVYTWNQYIKANTLGGLEFYIDEYDGDGNWISGQFKGGIYAPFTGIHSITYVPSRNIVRIVRVQYITVSNVDNDLYLDSVELLN